jgi:hypothetical protein
VAICAVSDSTCEKSAHRQVDGVVGVRQVFHVHADLRVQHGVSQGRPGRPWALGHVARGGIRRGDDVPAAGSFSSPVSTFARHTKQLLSRGRRAVKN